MTLTSPSDQQLADTGSDGPANRRSARSIALLTAPAILLLGFLSGRAAQSGPDNPWFALLEKPAIYPPPAAFGIVWSILYVMMGIALALVIAAPQQDGRKPAIVLFAIQLLLNLGWTPLFFGAHQMTGALVLIGVLVLVLAATIAAFWRINRAAGLLLVPYFGWVCFATVLTYSFLSLNPALDGA